MSNPLATTPVAEGEQVLTQSDVDRLLAQMADQQSTMTVFTAAGNRKDIPRDSVQPYDFRQPAFLAAGELRRLRLHHETIIRTLAARLSVQLRMEFALQMSGLQTVNFQKFVETLPTQTHMTLFQAAPLQGVCLLEISPRLGLTIVDRMLGGPGNSIDGNRDLTEIELALLDQTVEVIIGEWCSHWLEYQQLRATLVGHETNPRFLQFSHPDDMVFALTMEGRFGDCVEQLRLCFPYYTIEPLMRRITAEHDPTQRAGAPRPTSVPRWDPKFDNVPIPLTAGFCNVQLPARAIAELKVGDVIPLDPEQFNRIQVSIAQLPKFQGRLGTSGTRWAVELTGLLHSLLTNSSHESPIKH